MKYCKVILYALGVISSGFIVSILAFYFHAGKILGRFPSYNNPDPKELKIYSDYSPFVNGFGSIWFYTFGIWLLVALIYLTTNRKNSIWKPILISSIGHIISVYIVFSGIMEWYID